MARSGGDALKQRSPMMDLSLQGRDFSSLFDSKGNPTKHKLNRHGAADLDWIDNVPLCPVFHPTKEQFKDPLLYLQSIAPQASKYGICKIVSPLVASVPATLVLTKEQPNFKFTTHVQPLRLANWDNEDKIKFCMSGRDYTLPEYEKMANKIYHRKFSTAATLPPRLMEMEFWREMVSGKMLSVEYACDIEGSAFSSSKIDDLGQSKWNLKEISQLPESILRLLEYPIPGVTEPMLYIGMLFSTFAWHVEDHYLYSINYHHCGASKTWYGVPGHAASDFEKVVQEHVYDKEMLAEAGEGAAYDLLIGKTTMFAPKLLVDHGVPVFRAVQEPGEFVITFPRSYHAGFSHGFNCGEAVNFAMDDWFPLGAAALGRYEQLRRIPLLPHEELLCKEAIAISDAEAERPRWGVSVLNSGRCDAKAAFVSLMRFQKQAQMHLAKGAELRSVPACGVSCSLCKHSCYLSFAACKCFSEPVCLNHGKDSSRCRCGCERSIFVRDDFAEMEAIASTFQSDEGVSKRVSKEEPFSLFDSFQVTNPPSIPDSLTNSGLPQLEYPLPHHNVTSLAIDEDDSDSEAFRVKRRRVSTIDKKSVVDEPLRKQVSKSPLITTGVDDLRSIQPLKVYITTKGDHAVLVRDIMRELDIKGSTLEVMKKWLLIAQNKAVTLKTHRVVIESKQHLAFSIKGCKCLRKVLPDKEAFKLRRIIDEIVEAFR